MGLGASCYCLRMSDIPTDLQPTYAKKYVLPSLKEGIKLDSLTSFPM